MLRYIFSIKLLFLTLTVFGQTKFNEDSLNFPLQYGPSIRNFFQITETGKYNPDSNKINSFHLVNGFRKSVIINKNEWLNIRDEVKPKTITLIFSKYPLRKGVYYEIYPLLCDRLKNLFSFDPELNDISINYQIIFQTDFVNEKEVSQLFHGFRIDYDTIPAKQINNDIIPDSMTLVAGLTPEQMIKFLDLPSAFSDSVSAEDDSIRGKKISNYLEKKLIEKKKIRNQIPSNPELKKTYNKVEQFLRLFPATNVDSTVYRVMNRNNWDSILVIVDWTGSMYRYGADILKWHILNFKNSPIKYFVLFNDGDNKKVKEIGNTGGIYGQTADNVEELFNLYSLVMLKGRGGESEENDIEAVLKGITMFPRHKSVVLIADNSCIRDIQLASQIHEPVNVVMVGYNPIIGINTQYIELAKNTKGTIHTIENDISYGDKSNISNSRIRNLASRYIFCDYSYPISDEVRMIKSKMFWNIDSAKQYNEGYVSLNISHKNLTRLPKKINKFKNLIGLDLSFNKIRKFDLHKSQGHILQKLKLNNNELEKIPDKITSCSYIRELDLGNNQIKTVPLFIFDFRVLKYLNLSFNQIDSLPKIQTRSIRKLLLNNNNISELPVSFGSLRYLEELDMSNNSLSSLPPTFIKCKKLKFLKLNNNMFSTIPKEIYKLRSLQILDIRNNHLDEKELDRLRLLLPKTEIEY